MTQTHLQASDRDISSLRFFYPRRTWFVSCGHKNIIWTVGNVLVLLISLSSSKRIHPCSQFVFFTIIFHSFSQHQSIIVFVKLQPDLQKVMLFGICDFVIALRRSSSHLTERACLIIGISILHYCLLEFSKSCSTVPCHLTVQ